MKKHNFTNHVLLSICTICLSFSAFSQVFYDTIYNSKVKSIQFYKTGDNLSNPNIQLLNNETLTIKFDMLHSNSFDVRYEFVFCDKNWRKSNLHPSEYCKIFGIQRFEKQNSINTTIEYVNYETTFPNQDIKFLLSGNYIVQVFNDETNEILFQKRFTIYEQIIKLDASEKQASTVKYMDNYQEVNVVVSPLGFPLPNAESNLSIVMQQNGRWDNAKMLTRPSHITIDKISFDNNEANLFLGGAEFNQFNFKNFKIGNEKVSNIYLENDTFRIIMHPNEVRTYKPYKPTGDLNGKFVPSYEIIEDADFAGDYAKVTFTLPYYKEKYDTLNMYIIGGFNQWLLTDENRMYYNNEKSQYEAHILLKQGYYDFAIAQVSNDKTYCSSHEIDGSYYQTENSYEVFVYFYDMEVGYDRIIGYKKINSKK